MFFFKVYCWILFEQAVVTYLDRRRKHRNRRGHGHEHGHGHSRRTRTQSQNTDTVRIRTWARTLTYMVADMYMGMDTQIEEWKLVMEVNPEYVRT